MLVPALYYFFGTCGVFKVRIKYSDTFMLSDIMCLSSCGLVAECTYKGFLTY
jgi:hypothetical protein